MDLVKENRMLNDQLVAARGEIAGLRHDLEQEQYLYLLYRCAVLNLFAAEGDKWRKSVSDAIIKEMNRISIRKAEG